MLDCTTGYRVGPHRQAVDLSNPNTECLQQAANLWSHPKTGRPIRLCPVMEKKNIGKRYFQSIQVWARAWFSVGCGNFTCSGLNSWFVLFIIRFFIHFISLTPACGPVSVWPLCALSPWSQFNSASYALVLVSILLTSFFIFLVPHLMWFVFGFASPVLFFLTLFSCVPWCFNLPNYLVCIWISTFLFLLQFSSCCVLSVFFSSPDIFLDYLCLCFFPPVYSIKAIVFSSFSYLTSPAFGSTTCLSHSNMW